MIRTAILAAGLAAMATGCNAEPGPAETSSATASQETAMLYETEFTTITGEPLPFASFRGKPVLVVNTASRCGYTPQYEGLQALWTRYRDAGLVVLGVPSNDFGGQEPGTEEQVQQFCEINYGVDFPLTSKTAVTGTGRHPFYAGAEDALGEAARPKWNFHKILIGADGTPLKAFPSAVKPSDDDLIQAIEQALKG